MKDLHLGIPQWREALIARRGKRVRGVWDASLARETLVLRDGRRLTYFVDGTGNGLTVFCFHAMFVTGNSFIMSDMPRDCRLVCMNRPGYYGSDVPGGDYSHKDFCEDVKQLADYLQIDQFAVVGHSSGGPCALACAALMPERITAVGLLASDPEYAHVSVPNKRAVNAVCIGQVLPAVIKCVPVLREGRPGLVNDYRIDTQPYAFETESVNQPTLVYVGEDDKVLPWKTARHVYERLPRARLVVVPKVGHLGLLRDHVLQQMLESLSSIANGDFKDKDASDVTWKTQESDLGSIELMQAV
jgi:pimeloyl-ACP methyl ester carboxylesterase